MRTKDAHKIGMAVDDLRMDVRSALTTAAAMAFRAVELGVGTGTFVPEALGSSGRRELSHFVDGLGLELVSLSADLPRLSLSDPRTSEQRVDRTTQLLDLARDLGVPVVTTGVGALTDAKTGEPSDLVIEALDRLGEYADSRGVRLALRPSYDAGERWVSLLKRLNCPSLRVCLDPAAIVMTGANPLSALEQYIEQVAVVHARDATAGFSDPHGGEPRLGQETALGGGEVDFVGLLDVLREAEYRGPYILRRRETRNAQQDLTAARDVFRNLLG